MHHCGTDDESDMNKKPWSCPEEMPANLVDQYTMNKQIGSFFLKPYSSPPGGTFLPVVLPDVVLWYKCQTGPQYDKEHRYSDELVEEQISRVEKRLVNFYGETDSMLYRLVTLLSLVSLFQQSLAVLTTSMRVSLLFFRSLDAFPITGKEVVIMGSQRPIYESVCIVFGGSSCTTIDFQPIIVSHPKLKYASTTSIAHYLVQI
jgi:hypothetical protein